MRNFAEGGARSLACASRAPVYPQPAFDKYYAAKKADPSWRTYEVTCGHDVTVDAPDRLVENLLEAA